MESSCDPLLLENQLCFPLYAASKALIRRYEPYLSPLDLTYTQYIVLMVLWEKQDISVQELGERVHLDSGTLSPLLKKLLQKELIVKSKGDDGRYCFISLTSKGFELKEKCSEIPAKIGSCLNLSPEEALLLYQLCYKTLRSVENHG